MDEYIKKSDVYKILFEELKNAIEERIDNFQSTNTQNWIPSYINPPEEEKTYLVQVDSGWMCLCRWTNHSRIYTNTKTDWHWNIYDIPQYTQIVAWQEKPAPYKGEGK